MIKLLNGYTKRVFSCKILEITPGGNLIELYSSNPDGAGDSDYYHSKIGDNDSIVFLGHFPTLKKSKHCIIK